MTGWRWVVPGGLVVFGALQLVGVDRTNPPIAREVRAPGPVMGILKRACYDCHSNRTAWPWYSRVAPMSWLVAHHVHEGRGDLNFTEWPEFDQELKDQAFHDIRRQLSKKKMPLRSYLLLHPEARLTDADRDTLLRWAEGESGYTPAP
jgi:Haem-binding domain